MVRFLVYFIIISFLFPILLYAEQVIQFNPPEWDVDEVNINDYYTREIQIKTTGNKPIDIINVRPSCECLKVKILNPKIIMESPAVISATLHIDNTLNAYFRIFFYVHTNDPKNQIIKFYIVGKIKGKGLPSSEIVIFRTSVSKNYEQIQKKIETLKSNGDSLIIKEYLANDIDSYRLRAQMEKQYSLSKYADVEMFTVKGAFIGNEEILKELDRLLAITPIVSGASSQTTHNMAGEENLVKGALEILYFYSIGCGGCFEIENQFFPKLIEKYGSKIFIRKLDIGDIKNYEQLIRLEERYQIKSNEPVSIFLSNHYLLGSKNILQYLDEAINESLKEPENLSVISSTGVVTASLDTVTQRFRSFSVMTIIGAGLLDGINPCVFATIIFFISFLSFVGRSRRGIILVGVFYTITVFLTYLLLGIGIFKAIQSLSVYGIIANMVQYLTATLVFCLAGLSLYDIVIYLKTQKTSGITLQLPLALKQKIHSVIRENVKSGSLVIGVMVIGFLVTLFEAACTGQVYLPTIVFVLKDPTLKVNAVMYLILYNLMFIIPLVVVFMLVYFGVQSQRLAEFSQRNIVLTKALLIILFIGLGILLLLA